MLRVIALAFAAKLLFLFLFFLFAPQVSAAAKDAAEDDSIPLTYSMGFSYISGDYTDEDKTEIFYVPVSVEADLYPFSVKLSVPFLVIDGPSGVIDGNTTSGSTQDLVSIGIGQIAGKVSYLIAPFHEVVPWFEITGKLRVPSEKPGALGSGQLSFSLQGDVFKRYGLVTGFAGVGRTFYSGDLDDRFYASVGASLRLSQRLSGGFAYDWFESTSDGGIDIQELTLFGSLKLGERWSVGPYTSFGISQSSADYAVGVSFTLKPPKR
jgi:hypothetical protein